MTKKNEAKFQALVYWFRIKKNKELYEWTDKWNND